VKAAVCRSISLCFLPEPHGHGSLRPGSITRCGSSACAQAAPAREKGPNQASDRYVGAFLHAFQQCSSDTRAPMGMGDPLFVRAS
jgi:hypothetical protein